MLCPKTLFHVGRFLASVFIPSLRDRGGIVKKHHDFSDDVSVFAIPEQQFLSSKHNEEKKPKVDARKGLNDGSNFSRQTATRDLNPRAWRQQLLNSNKKKHLCDDCVEPTPH
jgi:hypothetical protein